MISDGHDFGQIAAQPAHKVNVLRAKKMNGDHGNW